LTLDFSKGGEPEVEAAFARMLSDLQSAGLKLEEAKLPDLPFEAVAGLVIRAEAGSAFEEIFKDGRVRQMADPWAALSLASARPITASDYVKALRIRALCQRAMADFFAQWDVLLAPAEMMTAMPVAGNFDDVFWSDVVGGMSTLCGLPAAAVPCGFGRGGLPVGLTVVGGAFEEPKVFALARFYQSITDWHRRHPPIA